VTKKVVELCAFSCALQQVGDKVKL
jgi:hypothetical protein